MNSANSYDAQRYATYRAASVCLDAGDTRSSHIVGYEPDRRPTVRVGADVEVLYEGRNSRETSRIRTVCLGHSVRADLPNVSLITMGIMGVPDASFEVFVSQPDHVFGSVPMVLGPDGDVVAVLSTLVEGCLLPVFQEGTHQVPKQDPLLARAIERLESFRLLEPNWNGYDGVPPKSQAIDECLAFAMSLPLLAQAPVAMASGQGEVGLLWERDADEAFVEIGFRGDGSYGFLAVMPDGASTEEEGVIIGSDVPRALALALRVFLEG